MNAFANHRESIAFVPRHWSPVQTRAHPTMTSHTPVTRTRRATRFELGAELPVRGASHASFDVFIEESPRFTGGETFVTDPGHPGL